VATALIIIFAKLIGYIYTGSLTVFASMVDSVLDLVSSVVNLLAVHYALLPPDENHRFGHGKAEDLAVFVQSSTFILSGVYIGYSSINRLFFPVEIEQEFIAILLMVFSIVMTFMLICLQRFVIKRVKSSVLEADHFHYLTDLVTNTLAIGVLFVLKYTDFEYVDSIFAVFIAIYVIYGSIKLFNRSINNLMDKEFNLKDKEKIIRIIKSHPEVKGIHDLKTRYSGIKPIIQFHLELDGTISLLKAHEISTEVKQLILNTLPNSDIIIHQDPQGINEDVDYVDDII
jgi:ferrous-iron efflux pump FieF